MLHLGHSQGRFRADHALIEPPLPPPDVAAALLEDEELGITAPRFGVKMATHYTEADGSFFDLGDFLAWKIGFASSTNSLNFMLSGFALPEGGQMFVYGLQKQMPIGPVEPRHIYGGRYATDIIKGGQAVIEIVFPKAGRDDFLITVEGVTQGLDGLGFRHFGESLLCQVDVNCPLGNGWENERDAVVRILLQQRNGSQANHCSGVMVNNACQDLRPFLLTANHCAQNFVLDDFVFRFNYDSPNPVPPACRGAEPRVWLTYTGAVLLAFAATSDFALLELTGGIIGQPTIALAGWNRADEVPANGTAIHHPEGDVKKISVADGNLLLSNAQGQQGTTHILATWTVGTTELFSSGSPLFNPNRQVIGQVDSGNGICPPNGLTTYGRIFISWEGNMPDRRLRDWLGAGIEPAPMAINTIRAPFIDNGGSNFVCSSNKTFTLENPVPGRILSWSAEPAHLFADDGGAATSGASVGATLRAKDSHASGSAALTFRLAAEGCDEVEVSLPLWVGKPSAPSTSPPGTSPIHMGVGDLRTVFLSSAPGARSFAADWTAFGAVSKTTPDWPTAFAQFHGDYEGTGNWAVSTENDCGASPPNFGQFIVSGGCNPCQIVISNNPVQDVLEVSIPEAYLPALARGGSASRGQLRILDQMGRQVLASEMAAGQRAVDVSGLGPGLYVLHVNLGGQRFVGKVIKIR
jgi:lysyl endopeptidase